MTVIPTFCIFTTEKNLNRKNMKRTAVFLILSLCLVAAALIDLSTGSAEIGLKEIVQVFLQNENSIIREIILEYRIPKVLTAILAGAALSVCGLQMQTLFRNPLADPYIMGISTGAGLGVALFTMGASALGISGALFQNIGIAGAACIGATFVTVIILLVSQRLKNAVSLLIFGIMLSSIGGAIISLLQFWSSDSGLKAFTLWTMGSFNGINYTHLGTMAVIVFLGLGISIFNIKDLNLLLMGEEFARSAGLNENRSRNRILIAATLLAGGITAFCGPIGFIGIAVPHLCKMLMSTANHRILVPMSMLAGATLMVLADILSQSLSSSAIIPINTISAILGIPVILIIILKSYR